MKFSCDFSSEVDFFIEQNSWASCIPNSIVQAFYIMLKRQGFPPFLCSTSFLYYNIRALSGQEKENQGTTFTMALEAIHRFGMIPEEMWSSECHKNLTESPPQECYDYAKTHTWTTTASIHELPNCVEAFTEEVSDYLLDGYLILFAIRRYEGQFTSGEGVWTTPSVHQELPMGHAMLLCGIDFVQRYFIIINSTMDSRKECILYLSFDDFFLIRSWCPIKTHYDRIDCPRKLFYAIEHRQQSLDQVEPPPITKHEWQTHDSEIFYHHVIVGGGTILDAFLAYCLHDLFPEQSILLLSMTRNLFLQNNESLVSLQTSPLLASFLSKSGISCMPSTPPTSRIPDGFATFLCRYLNISKVDDLFTPQGIHEMLSDPVFSSIYFQDLVDMWNPQKDPGKELYLPTLSLESMPLILGVYVVLPHLISPQIYLSIKLTDLWSILLQEFKDVNLGDILDELPLLVHLRDWSTMIQEKDHCVYLHRSTTLDECVSDSLKVHCAHIYQTSSWSVQQDLAHRTDYITGWRSCIQLFISERVERQNETGNFSGLGEYRWISPQQMQIFVNEKNNFANLRLTKPDLVCSHVLFDLDIWPELCQSVQEFLKTSLPIRFMYSEYLARYQDICVQQENVWQVLEQQFAVESFLHWLNPDSSFLFNQIEGSLQIVNLFLKQYVEYYGHVGVTDTLTEMIKQTKSRKTLYVELVFYIFQDILKMPKDTYQLQGYFSPPNANESDYVVIRVLAEEYLDLWPMPNQITKKDSPPLEWKITFKDSLPFYFLISLLQEEAPPVLSRQESKNLERDFSTKGRVLQGREVIGNETPDGRILQGREVIGNETPDGRVLQGREVIGNETPDGRVLQGREVMGNETPDGRVLQGREVIGLKLQGNETPDGRVLQGREGIGNSGRNIPIGRKDKCQM